MTSDSTVVPTPSARRDRRSADRRPEERRPPAAGPGDRGGGRGVPGHDEGHATAGRARAPGAARAGAGAPGPDRDRSGRGAAGEAARPRRRRGGRAHPLHLGDPAALGAADAEPGCAAADPLPARRLDGRLPGGARRLAGQGRAEPVAVGDRAAEGRLGGRLRALAAARPVGPALRLHLGRRRLPAGAAWSPRPSACWC